jgi:hypothetical protein
MKFYDHLSFCDTVISSSYLVFKVRSLVAFLKLLALSLCVSAIVLAITCMYVL